MNKLSPAKKHLLAYLIALIFIISALLPNFAHAEPKKVTIGVYVTRLFDTNLHTDDYSATLWLWFLYHPFDSWGPENNIDFLNSKDVEKLTSASSQAKDGEIWWQGKYRVMTIADWNVQNYPFDVQNIYLLLEDSMLEASQLEFIADVKNSGVALDAISHDWELTSFDIKTAPAHTITNFGDPQEKIGSDFSRVTIHLQLKRANSWTKFISVFSANFISILLAFTVTLLPIDNWQARLSLSAASTFVAVGGRYSLQNLLPYSRHFTLSDKIELLVFIYIFIVISNSILCGHLHKHHREKAARRINETVIIASILLIPFCNYLFLRNIV